MERRLLTAAQTARVLGVSSARVYEMVRANLLPSVHLGRAVRVDSEKLSAFIEQGGRKLPGGWRRADSRRRA
jgi:excisionase family DNA binding protein